MGVGTSVLHRNLGLFREVGGPNMGVLFVGVLMTRAPLLQSAAIIPPRVESRATRMTTLPQGTCKKPGSAYSILEVSGHKYQIFN